MTNLLTYIRQLNRRQKMAVTALVAVILLTWLAVCVVLLLPVS